MNREIIFQLLLCILSIFFPVVTVVQIFYLNNLLGLAIHNKTAIKIVKINMFIQATLYIVLILILIVTAFMK